MKKSSGASTVQYAIVIATVLGTAISVVQVYKPEIDKVMFSVSQLVTGTATPK